MKASFRLTDKFENRHIGPNEKETNDMLQSMDLSSLDELIDKTVPSSIRLSGELNLPVAKSEYRFLQKFKALADNNQVFKSYIGLGYYGTITPTVILRNVLENPGWYTAYTPYQAEIAQGRLEALINYQTMVTDLTGMEVANSSLLDEATAAAEAMTLSLNVRKGQKKKALQYFVSDTIFPQTLDVLKTRALPLNIELVVGDFTTINFDDYNFFGAILQYPNVNGEIEDVQQFVQSCNENNITVAFAADLLSLALLTPPGELGADIVVGSTQRFGVPMGFGGPHAAYFATKEAFKRQLPGRIIGVSQDAAGKKAYRMALQTREQHIRREKATSNICTAQVLLAVISGFYAVYHGETGIRNIANRIHGLARILDNSLQQLGFEQLNQYYFDTIRLQVEDSNLIKTIAENQSINFRYKDNVVIISLDQTTGLKDLVEIVKVFETAAHIEKEGEHLVESYEINWPEAMQRKSSYLQHPVFNTYHSEHEMLRYLKRLENKDLSLAHSMISLGSCTMKLNATSEMIPVTWDGFSNMHPFVPLSQAGGYLQLINELSQWLCEITGFDEISFQPNSGAQGEYAGLLVIQAYHEANQDHHRNICLIPSSAHGTNPASAVMAGMKVVIVACDEKGNIDLEDLQLKVNEHSDNLNALMVTYPSTHGVFEESIKEICDLIHENGGQVYMDGANMNAQVGLTSPASIGADVCHINLHKTFCIPHGGGGPGMGPIGVAAHLSPFLPGHAIVPIGNKEAISAVSAAPWGSSSILPISYAYIAMMGGKGLTDATKYAILNANYIRHQLENHYDILYTGSNGTCAHEMIVDFRKFKKSAGIEVEDIAKRLMDYGFHAPTVSFPVAGTLMIEPTESETKEELDRFILALIHIRKEIADIEEGHADIEDNVLKNAPHTADAVISSDWNHSYTREEAVYPLEWVKSNKFWPSVSRIDNAYGDRNLYCSCIPVSDYVQEEN